MPKLLVNAVMRPMFETGRTPFTPCILLAAAIVLGGCPEAPKPAPPPPPEKTPETPETPETPGSQPGSSASKAEVPEGHTTSTTAADLVKIFKLPQMGEVAAIVGTSPISSKQYEHQLRQMQLELMAVSPNLKLNRLLVLEGALDRTIERVLRLELAKKLNVKPRKEVAELWMAQMEARIKEDKVFAAFLARAGKTKERRLQDSYDFAVSAAIFDKLRDESVASFEGQAKDYYQRNKKDYIDRAGREVWRIFLKAPRGLVERDRAAILARAEDIVARAKKKPANFVNLAKSFSEGGKAHEGGYIGWVSTGTLEKTIEDKIMKAKKDAILIHEAPMGYYIYRVGDARKENAKPFEEVKDSILQHIYTPVIEKDVKTRLKELRKSIKVDLKIEELKELRKKQAAYEASNRPKAKNPKK